MSAQDTLPEPAPTPQSDPNRPGRLTLVFLGLGLLAAVAAVLLTVTGLVSYAVPGSVVMALLGVAALQATVSLAGSRQSRQRPGGPPSVLARRDCRRPGATVAADVADADCDNEAERTGSRLRLRRRLRALAIAILAERAGVSEEEAADRLAAGEWTDEPLAAALFTADDLRRGLRERLRAVLPRGRPFAAQVHAAVRELEAISDRSPTQDFHVDEPGTDRSAGPWQAGVWRTDYWTGAGGVALLLVAGGVLTGTPALVLAGAVFLALAGYSRFLDPPEPSLAVDRTFDPPDPAPGTRVDVTVEVRNVGERILPDLRLVDRVPDHLAVVEGSPAVGTVLRPGASRTLDYTVVASAGSHSFEALYVAAREPSGAVERTTTLATDTHRLDCDPSVTAGSVPLHPKTVTVTGNVRTVGAGAGLEFHDLREYRRGDPLRRVDWNALARTGELATRRFHEEHAASVVLLVDVRPVADLAPARDSPTAIDRSLVGATALLETLASDGDRIGLATLEKQPRWVPPGSGTTHIEQLRAELARPGRLRAGTDAPEVDVTAYRSALATRLPSDAQLVLLSPLPDGTPVRIAAWLQATGYPVTVLSPDPTTSGSIGARVAALERDRRLDRLRNGGVRVIDWPRDTPVSAAISRARGGGQ